MLRSLPRAASRSWSSVPTRAAAINCQWTRCKTTSQSSSSKKGGLAIGQAIGGVSKGGTIDDEALFDTALKDALDKMMAEEAANAKSSSEPTKIDDIGGPIFDDSIAATHPTYDPADLPLVQDLDPRLRPVSEEEWHATLVHGRSFLKPYLHPQIYRIPLANLHLRSHHPHLLRFFSNFALHAAAALGVPVSQPAMLPTQRRLWTVPRSPFVHKKSQENFERRVHKRAMKVWDADGEVVDRWFAYLRKHAMAGVGMKVTRWYRLPIGFGRDRMGFVEERFAVEQAKRDAAGEVVGSLEESERKIRKVAEEIVRREIGVGKDAQQAPAPIS